MSERIDALVNPQMLIWARHKSGFDISGAARRIGVKPERLQEWESGDIHPTISQAIKMAEVYRRPLSAFYLNEPPQNFSVTMTDFRRLPEAEADEFSPGLIREIREAESRREIMLQLAGSEEDGSFPHSRHISLYDDPADIAEYIRGLIDISWETQRRWRDPRVAINGWKEAIEQLNVLVFHSNHQGISFSPSEAHGFSLSEIRFPVIVLNSKDVVRRRVFTLLHEFVHLLLNAGGICDTWEYSNIQNAQQRTEVFCNHVAGAVLVPDSLLLVHKVVSSHEYKAEWLDEEIWELAKDFSTSQEVIVRRLLALDLATHQFYESKRQEYLAAWLEYKNEKTKNTERNGPPHYRMVMRKNGKPFTRQIFYAYYDNKITLSDVSEYLGAKVAQVKRMERELFPMPKGA